MKNYKIDWYIYLLLLFAFLLRIPGIFDGLPAVYNSTEHYLARTVLGMGAAKTLDPGIYIYPTFYTYFLFILYGSFYVIGGLVGFFQNQYDFAVQFLTDPSLFYILARSVNVLLSLATIYILYRSLKDNVSPIMAQFAAAFMAVSYYMIRFSDFATADTFLIFFSTISTLAIFHLVDSRELKNYFYAGIFCGLAIATKYNAGFLAFGLMWVVVQNWYVHRIKILPTAGLSLGGIFLGFLSTNPLWLLSPGRFYEGWRLVSSQMYNAVSANKGFPYIWEMTRLIQDEMVIGLLFVIATVFFLFHKKRQYYPLLIVILLTFLFVGSWTKKGIDYLFAAFPAWIILSSAFADYLFRLNSQYRHLLKILLLLIVLPSFIGAVHQFIRFSNEDTREQTTDWIIEHVQSGQLVCYDNSHIDLGVFDIQRYLSYGANADQLVDPIKQKLKKLSTHPRQVNFIPILEANSLAIQTTENAYEAEALKYKRRELADLIRVKTSYLITNSWFTDIYLSIDMEDYPFGVQKSIHEVQKFYKHLEQDYKPLKVFRPNFWRSGPEISIYELK